MDSAPTGKIIIFVLLLILAVCLPFAGVAAEDEEEEEIRNPFEMIYTPEDEEVEEETEIKAEEDMTDQIFVLTTSVIDILEEDFTAGEIADRVTAAVDVKVDENRLRELLADHLAPDEEQEEVEVPEETEYVDPKLAPPDDPAAEPEEEIEIEVEEPVPEIFLEEAEAQDLEELLAREIEVENDRPEPGERGRKILDRFLHRDVDEEEEEAVVRDVEEIEPHTLLEELTSEPADLEEAEDLQEFIERLVGAEVDLKRPPGEAVAEVLEKLDEIEHREDLDELLESILY